MCGGFLLGKKMWGRSGSLQVAEGSVDHVQMVHAQGESGVGVAGAVPPAAVVELARGLALAGLPDDTRAREVLLVADGEEMARPPEHVGHLHRVPGAPFLEPGQRLLQHHGHHLARRQPALAQRVEHEEYRSDQRLLRARHRVDVLRRIQALPLNIARPSSPQLEPIRINSIPHTCSQPTNLIQHPIHLRSHACQKLLHPK